MSFGPARRLALLAAFLLAGAALASTASASTYVVLYNQQSVQNGAAARIQQAGGALVASYPQIGVVIARSDSASFRGNLSSDNHVAGVASTAGFASRLPGSSLEAIGPPLADLLNIPANDSAEPLFPMQWDMRQIHTPEAHAITGGSPDVLVADLDTGLDFTSPDLARTTTRPTAPTARAVRRPRSRPETTSSGTGRTRPGRSPRPRTASGSSESPRT